MQALTAHGARVLDATGTGALDKQRFLAALEAEKTRNHADSAFDVMVGIQRVLEGRKSCFFSAGTDGPPLK